jgi:hypothetical protein
MPNVILLSVVMLSVVMLSVVMLSVVMLSVVMLSLMAPKSFLLINNSIFNFSDEKEGQEQLLTSWVGSCIQFLLFIPLFQND